MEFTMTLLGLAQGIPVAARQSLAEAAAPTYKGHSVHSSQCIHTTLVEGKRVQCDHVAAKDEGNGWLCRYHQGMLDRKVEPVTVDQDEVLADWIVGYEQRNLRDLADPGVRLYKA